MAESKHITYKITTTIADTRDLDESSFDVQLTIFGLAGLQTNQITLSLDKEKRSVETEVQETDIGSITKINLTHALPIGGIMIESIKITKNNRSRKISVNKWLEADGEKSLDFLTGSSRTQSGKSTYSQAINFARNITSAKSSRTNQSRGSSKKLARATREPNTTVNRTNPVQQKPPLTNRTEKTTTSTDKSTTQSLLRNRYQKETESEFESQEGQGRLKPENHPIKTGEFELATHIELRRVKTGMYKEVAKIKYPRRKKNQPFVFNDLAPYAETRLAENIVCSSEYNQPIGYCNRFTAMGVVDPWISYRMEHTVGPLISRNLAHNARGKVNTSKKALNRPDNIEGSTLAPNFPKVIIKKPKGMNGPFYYDDVEIIRAEFTKNFKNKARFEEDRNRTINDYYRMNLDVTAQNHHMSGAYNAYLKNTPGSKKALEELLALGSN